VGYFFITNNEPLVLSYDTCTKLALTLASGNVYFTHPVDPTPHQSVGYSKEHPRSHLNNELFRKTSASNSEKNPLQIGGAT
jgi:hypothetical protein